jgi:hypothetical protein
MAPHRGQEVSVHGRGGRRWMRDLRRSRLRTRGGLGRPARREREGGRGAAGGLALLQPPRPFVHTLERAQGSAVTIPRRSWGRRGHGEHRARRSPRSRGRIRHRTRSSAWAQARCQSGVPAPAAAAPSRWPSFSFRSISRSVETVAGGVHGHEEVSKRFASLQALSRAMVRRDAASPLDLTRYKVW